MEQSKIGQTGKDRNCTYIVSNYQPADDGDYTGEAKPLEEEGEDEVEDEVEEMRRRRKRKWRRRSQRATYKVFKQFKVQGFYRAIVPFLFQTNTYAEIPARGNKQTFNQNSNISCSKLKK